MGAAVIAGSSGGEGITSSEHNIAEVEVDAVSTAVAAATDVANMSLPSLQDDAGAVDAVEALGVLAGVMESSVGASVTSSPPTAAAVVLLRHSPLYLTRSRTRNNRHTHCSRATTTSSSSSSSSNSCRCIMLFLTAITSWRSAVVSVEISAAVVMEWCTRQHLTRQRRGGGRGDERHAILFLLRQ